MMRSFIVLLVSCFGLANTLNAQQPTPKDTMSDVVFMRVMEQSIAMYLAEYTKDPNYDSIKRPVSYETNTRPQF